jgi:hypothetical protein
MTKYLRRLVVAAVAALGLTAGLLSAGQAPALANHDNWNWFVNVEDVEHSDYVDMDADVIWKVGSSSMRPCSNVVITNNRPGTHSLRLQYVSRASGFVSWDVTVSNVDPGEIVSVQAPTSLIAISSEPYLKAWWGDLGYPVRELDYFYNWAGDSNDVVSPGTYCP